MVASVNRLAGLIVGILLVLVGAGGFLVTTGVGFCAVPGGLLLWTFEVNPLQNVVHLLLGAALLTGALAGVRAAKTVTSIAGSVLLVLGLFGLFVVGTPLNVLALNGADNVLHFGTSMLLLAVGLGAERTRT